MAGIGRREIIGLAGAAAIVAGWQRFGRREPPLEFRELRGAPGWSFALAGAVTGGLSSTDLMTIGLEDRPEPLPVARLSQVVHQHPEAPGIPVAIFSDFFCPYCRELIGRIDRWEGLNLTWHELPLQGRPSEIFARAAIAAEFQGGYRAYYAQMLKDGFRPASGWLGTVAERAGLDADRLLADMRSEAVTRHLADSAGAAAQLGIRATPGIVVRQRSVLGALSDGQFEALLNEV